MARVSDASRYDVAIAGGGLAGLCLALEVRSALPDARILVVERNPHPLAEAAHKVGESSVEVASHYFQHVLGLDELLASEVPKFGLRFFMSQGENRDIASRVECGPSHFLTVPSFQIDRGQFENALADRARKLGIEFRDACRISAVDLAPGDGDHTIAVTDERGHSELTCRWLVDASGRAGLLKKKLGLARASRHKVNAVWFRVDHTIDPDGWSDDASWRSRLEHPRRLSTNHLMGEGYWVWLIPLANGRTSVGIVSDEFVRLVEAPGTREAVTASKKEGIVNGVEVTPTLFINGRRWLGDLTLDEIVDVVGEEVDRLQE